MVKEKKIISPVYPVAVGAGVAFYAGCSAGLQTIRITCIFIVAGLFFFGTASSLRFLLPQTTTRKRFLFFCFVLAGIMAGSLCALRVHAELRQPLTLADQSRVSSVKCILLSDPSPYGQYSYRTQCRITSCKYTDQSEFSASGLFTLVIPSEMIRQSLPGGMIRKGSDRIIFSSGLILEAHGRFAPYEYGKPSLFIVSDNGLCTKKTDREKTFSALGWLSSFDRYRSGLRLALMRILFDWKDAGGFLLALLSGSRDYLEPTLATDFRLSGLSHILALSGMHLSLLGLIVIKTGRFFGGKRISVRLSLVAIVLFVWFAGGSPSLNRALIFAVLMILVRGIGFEARVLPILAATCIVQMLFDPAETLSLAFILSCSALWGILTFGESLLVIAEPWIPRSLYSDFAASTGAQLMTAPVIACSIGVLAPSGLIASCLISPLSTIFLVAGSILLAAASLCPPLAHGCGLALCFLYKSIAVPAHFFARFPVLHVRDLSVMIPASIIPVAVGFVLLYVSAGLKKRRSPDAGFTRL